MEQFRKELLGEVEEEREKSGIIRTLRLIGSFMNTKTLFKKGQGLVQVTKGMKENTLVYPENYMAQEECLCRSSNLIASLSVNYVKENFYKWNKKSAKNMFSDRIIYSSNACVIKSDAVYPEILEKPFFEVAIQNEVDILVLGAFGCGMFHNPPELVAGVFKRLLVEEYYQEYFERVIFAIKGGGKDRKNIDAFEELFVVV